MKKVFVFSLFIAFCNLFIIGCQKDETAFKNLNFNTACESMDSLCVWQNSYSVRSSFNYINASGNKNDFSLCITNTNNGVGYAEQTHKLQDVKEETIFTFSAHIKTENLQGKGAGLTIGIYDDKNTFLQGVDSGHNDFNYVKNTTDWTAKTLKIIIPKEAKILKIGIIAYGTGKAFFDNANVSFTKIVSRQPSALAKDYIDKAGDSIMKHSLFKENINIKPIKEKAYAIAGDAKTAEDTYLAIEYILEAIKDQHAFFMPANERTSWEGNDTKVDIDFNSIAYSKSEVKENFGYIAVPGFRGNDYKLKVAFADTIQKQIQQLYTKKVKGFIIDLRQNDGGNMDPMLAGLEPLYSADTTGFLIDVNKKREYWGRNQAFKKALGNDYTQPTIQTKIDNQLPIAVLYGNATGSSGEIIIISFIGNANTKSFGQPSFGLTTGNGEYKLPDGSYMFLSSTYMADRNGKIYKSKITPDEVIEETDNSKDKTLEAALNWLKKQ